MLRNARCRLCKLNCVMLYSHSISSVGERPAPRGGTTRPDERPHHKLFFEISTQPFFEPCKISSEPERRNTPLSEAAVWSLPLWGRGGIDKVPLCKVIMGDERQGSLTLPWLFMLPSIQSIPVYGFLFHPTKITSWGKNVQEYGVKTIKSVENKYLWSTFLVEVLVCLDEADRQK